MSSFNKITVLGYLGKDPEIRYLTDGTAVCSFSVATTERKKDKSGDYHDATMWFKVNVWGKQGEAANQYLSKGSQVYVDGRLSQQEYTDRDGNKRTSLEVRASEVQFLSSKAQGESVSQPAQQRPIGQTQASHKAAGFGENDLEDLPF